MAIFELIALVVAPPLTAGIGYIINRFFNHTMQDELNHAFHQYWDGKPENERYAWQMVRNQIMQTTMNQKKLKRIEQILSDLNDKKSASKWTIDEKGNLL